MSSQQFLFGNLTVAARVLGFRRERCLWGETPLYVDAAGRAGSLRGPRRVFLCAFARHIGAENGLSRRLARRASVPRRAQQIMPGG
jgi:hypothetical protein